MTPEFKFHMERVKAATINRHSLAQIPEWVQEHTFLNMRPFTFRNHEYQEVIMRDQSVEKVIRKCSQIGISELSARIALAMCNMIPGFTVIYTLPTASFAATFVKTRIDPVIQSSAFLRDSVNSTVDNAEVKAFAGGSFLYCKGSQSTNAPISIPCHMLMHDELDFSDPGVISQYQSRLTHSEIKRKLKLSTPTLPDRGIDREFKRSRRHFNFVKCDHCNHYFVPDYYKHVRMVGSTQDLRAITKTNLHEAPYATAYVECPKCGGKPSLQPQHREWVCENPDEGFIAAGYQVTPFDAPNIITPGYLIEASTQYKKITDFCNFNLGMPAEDQESTLLKEELQTCLIDSRPEGSASYVIGLDLGMVCWITVAAVTSDQHLIVVHTEGIPLQNVRQRYGELRKLYRVRLSVADALPYTETIMAMQQVDSNLYSSIFVRAKSTETFNLKRKDEDSKQGKLDMRQININRDRAFDALMDGIRVGLIWKVRDENDDLWVKHCTSMSRMREWSPDMDELRFIWRKSEEGEDHLWFSLLYAQIASQVIGASRNTGPALLLVPMSFKSKAA